MPLFDDLRRMRRLFQKVHRDCWEGLDRLGGDEPFFDKAAPGEDRCDQWADRTDGECGSPRSEADCCETLAVGDGCSMLRLRRRGRAFRRGGTTLAW